MYCRSPRVPRPFVWCAPFAASVALLWSNAIAPTANAAIYIDFGDFPGEATKEPHVDWINVLDVSFAIDRPTSGSGAQLEWADSTLQDIVVTKESDKSTPKLTESILTGKVHDKVVIDFTTLAIGGQPEQTWFQIEMEKVRLTSFSFHGDSTAPATETLTLNPEKIRWTYTEIDGDKTKGNVDFAWDVIGRQPVPEPSTAALALLGAVGSLGYLVWRKPA